MVRLLGSTIAVAAFVCTAQADVVQFYVYENEDNADTSGLNLFVDVTDGGSFVDFTFFNETTAPSTAVVTAVYFEDTDAIDGLLLDGRIAGESAGVDFEDGATPANPAPIGFGFGGPWAGTLYASGTRNQNPVNGVNALVDEWLTIRFDYGGGATFGDILDELTSNPAGFRIAQHVQGLGDFGDFSVWTTTVPAPASLAAIAFGGLLGTRRRR